MFSAVIKKISVFALVFGSLLISWEMISLSHKELQFVLPVPTRIIYILWEHADRFLFHSLATLKEMMGGFLIAFFVAFPLAWLMVYYRSLRVIFQPFFVMTQCIPIFTLAPLMILWFGWSYTAIIVPTALMIFFPLTMNIYQGLSSTPQHFLDFFKLHSATPWQIFYKLQLPWALPQVFSGLRISLALAGIGAVAGEWAGAQEGLGLLMLESRRAADIEMMYGALVCLTGLSLCLYFFAILLEKMMTKRQSHQISFTNMLMILFLVGTSLCGCTQSEKKETLLILDWLPNPNHVAIYSGMEQKIFQKYGINLKILKVIDPSDSIPFLTSKQVDLSLTYMPHTLHAISKGAEVVPVGILINQPLNALIYRKNEGINRPQDLNNLVVGYCVDGSNTGFLQVLLKSREIVPKKWRNVTFDLVMTIGTRQVDFIYGAYWNIECENLRALGIETDFFPLSDFNVPTYYELIFLARKNSLQASPEFISKFQKALQESINFAIANPKEAFIDYLKANPDKGSKTQVWEEKAWYNTLHVMAKDQQIDSNVWNTFFEWLKFHQLLHR